MNAAESTRTVSAEALEGKGNSGGAAPPARRHSARWSLIRTTRVRGPGRAADPAYDRRVGQRQASWPRWTDRRDPTPGHGPTVVHGDSEIGRPGRAE